MGAALKLVELDPKSLDPFEAGEALEECLRGFRMNGYGARLLDALHLYQRLRDTGDLPMHVMRITARDCAMAFRSACIFEDEATCRAYKEAAAELEAFSEGNAQRGRFTIDFSSLNFGY